MKDAWKALEGKKRFVVLAVIVVSAILSVAFGIDVSSYVDMGLKLLGFDPASSPVPPAEVLKIVAGTYALISAFIKAYRKSETVSPR